jgi:myo-inositol-1(or 4)-monophosphatase
MTNIPFDPTKVKNCIIDAGKSLLSIVDSKLNVSQKKDGSSVTEADNAINCLLYERLTDIYPLAGWLSEESKDSSERLDKEWVWIIDPLDGTKEFIQKIPEYSISIALTHKGMPVLGSVYNPLTGEGALGNVWEKKIECWGKSNNHHGLVVSRTEFGRSKMKFLVSEGMKIKPVGSVAYKLLLVSMGSADATFSLEPKSEWDLCGGVSLLLAAGLQFQKYDTSPVTFNHSDPLITSWTLGGELSILTEIRHFLSQREEYLNQGVTHGTSADLQTSR